MTGSDEITARFIIGQRKWLKDFDKKNQKELKIFLNLNNAGFLNVTPNKTQQVGTTF